MKPIFTAEDFCQHDFWKREDIVQYVNKILKERLTPMYNNTQYLGRGGWTLNRTSNDTHVIYCTKPKLSEDPTIIVTKEKIIEAYFKIKQLTILASEDDYLEALCKELGL